MVQFRDFCASKCFKNSFPQNHFAFYKQFIPWKLSFYFWIFVVTTPYNLLLKV